MGFNLHSEHDSINFDCDWRDVWWVACQIDLHAPRRALTPHQRAHFFESAELGPEACATLALNIERALDDPSTWRLLSDPAGHGASYEDMSLFSAFLSGSQGCRVV